MTELDIAKLALDKFDNIAISFSGAEDVVLIDMASKIKKEVITITWTASVCQPQRRQVFSNKGERNLD